MPPVTPRPAEPCIFGVALWVASVVALGAGVFVAGVWIASRIWPEIKS